MATPEIESSILTVLTPEASKARLIDLRNKERSWEKHKKNADSSRNSRERNIANHRLEELRTQMGNEI